jgi:hypothetical protein
MLAPFQVWVVADLKLQPQRNYILDEIDSLSNLADSFGVPVFYSFSDSLHMIKLQHACTSVISMKLNV